MQTASHYETLRLQTAPIPLHDRAAITRDVFGKAILNLEIGADPDVELTVDFTLRALDGLKIVTGNSSGVVSCRSRQMLADSNDDLMLSLNVADHVFAISQRGRGVELGCGEAVLVSCAEPAAFRRAYGEAIGLCVPRWVFAHMTPAIEDFAGYRIPRTSEPLQLLRSYIGGLDEDDALATPELRHLAVSHIHDLLILAIDSVGDAREQAANRGLKAARLRRIKAHVNQHLGPGELSIEAVADAQALTQRYIQRLFEAEGTTFSVFVGQQRLARAYRLLGDPRRTDLTVGAIARDCGFGNVSHFNRLFRRLYGSTPSDVRAGRDAGRGG
jgi:AraC-like DNA-binding protein